MATILIYAGVKSYKKYKLKKANALAAQNAALNKDSASIVSGLSEDAEDAQLPAYEASPSGDPSKHAAPFSPDSIGAPAVSSPPAFISELQGDSPVDYNNPGICELPGDSPIETPSGVCELAGDEPVAELWSPAPLHVVKARSPTASSPDEGWKSTQSLVRSEKEEEAEDEDEETRQISEKLTELEIPDSPEELLEFHPKSLVGH